MPVAFLAAPPEPNNRFLAVARYTNYSYYLFRTQMSCDDANSDTPLVFMGATLLLLRVTRKLTRSWQESDFPSLWIVSKKNYTKLQALHLQMMLSQRWAASLIACHIRRAAIEKIRGRRLHCCGFNFGCRRRRPAEQLIIRYYSLRSKM